MVVVFVVVFLNFSPVFKQMDRYTYLPGIHINTKLICTNYIMVSEKKAVKRKIYLCINKATSRHTHNNKNLKRKKEEEKKAKQQM